jgi:hypothetical protein
MIVAAPFEASPFSDRLPLSVVSFPRPRRIVSASEIGNAEFGPHPADNTRNPPDIEAALASTKRATTLTNRLFAFSHAPDATPRQADNRR